MRAWIDGLLQAAASLGASIVLFASASLEWNPTAHGRLLLMKSLKSSWTFWPAGPKPWLPLIIFR